MGHKHSREQILAAAVDEALEHGLARLTFGSVARRVGTSDRVVVYYLPSKDALVAEVLQVAGTRLRALLEEVVGEAADHRELVRVVWPHVARVEVDPLVALYFEAVGQAAAGAEPYHRLAAPLLGGWLDWMSAQLPPAARAAGEPEATLAVLDGLLLLRQLAGPEAADRAAAAVLG